MLHFSRTYLSFFKAWLRASSDSNLSICVLTQYRLVGLIAFKILTSFFELLRDVLNKTNILLADAKSVKVFASCKSKSSLTPGESQIVTFPFLTG